jgi:translocator protein
MCQQRDRRGVWYMAVPVPGAAAPPRAFACGETVERTPTARQDVVMLDKRVQVIGLAGWLAITALAAVIGGMGSAAAGEFYGALDRPAWAPPAWLFSPVWTVLYALMAIAAWLVWRERGFAAAATPLTLYGVQLVVNALWSWLFFAGQLGTLALLDIALLIALVLALTMQFLRIRPLAGALLLPYLAWIAFAAVLNLSLILRNPGLL